jgi:chitinase
MLLLPLVNPGNVGAQAPSCPPPPSTPILTIGNTTVTEGQTAFLPLTLSQPSPDLIEVFYTMQDQTATAPQDYQTRTGSFVFPQCLTSVNFHVVTNDDTVQEPPETLRVALLSASNATISQSPTDGVVTINDNDTPAPPTALTARVDDDDTNELDPGQGPNTADFGVSLSDTVPAGATVRIDYQTFDGTAKVQDDYVGAIGTLEFAAGERSKIVHVTIVNDTTSEPTETFTLRLSNIRASGTSAPGVSIARSDGTGTIFDDDRGKPQPPTISLSPAGQDVEKRTSNTLFFVVTLSVSSPFPNSDPITLNYSTASGSATGGSSCNGNTDFISITNNDLVFEVFQRQRVIAVTVCPDTTAEDLEQFTLTLSNPHNVVIGNGTATGKILPAPPPPPPAPANHGTVGANGLTVGLVSLTAFPKTGESVLRNNHGGIVDVNGNAVVTGANPQAAKGASSPNTNDGGSLVTDNGSGLIANDGGSIVATGAGNLITNDGGGLITNDGGS